VPIVGKQNLLAVTMNKLAEPANNGKVLGAIKPSVENLAPAMRAEFALAELRAAICEKCPHNNGISREVNRWPVHTVRCELCGCAGLSLTRGTCAAGKWPTDAPDLRKPELGTPEDAVGVATPSAGRDVREKLLLRSHLSPGDIVMLTATVRDLHRAYPGRFVTDVDSSASELWEHNPHITKLERAASDVRVVEMHYPTINQSNQRPGHFIHGYHQFLEMQMGLTVPVTEFKGDIHLSEDEKRWTNQVEENFGYKGQFWLLMAGGKYDFTTKWWSPDFYQQVVDHFLGRVQFVQCGEKSHWHPPLKGVFDLIGKTSMRQFIRLMYHAQGVVCPITMAMHLAAAVPTKVNRLRPCVVIAGGREPPHWEAYPGHQFLHTLGALSCCATGGCWRSRCQPANDGDSKDQQNLCERPVQIRPDLRIPQCMVMIKPAHVIAAIDHYLSGGTFG